MVDYVMSGAISAHVDGTKVSLGGPKPRCMLAVLLAWQGTVVSIDRLVDAVWDGNPPPKALASLRAYVANLRRDLDGGDTRRLRSHPNGYQLNLLPGDSIDLDHFGRLVSAGREALLRNDAAGAIGVLDDALTLWQGDPFGEFAYRDFAAPEVIRLTALRDTAIDFRFDACLQLGAGADLIPALEAEIARRPIQEQLWSNLMVALHRSGRTADALRAFERARTTLDREIGVEPGTALQALAHTISTEPSRPATPAPAQRSRPTPIVGRDRELGVVTETVLGACDGRGGLTLVTGESGIGKTSLAQAVAERVGTAGIAVAWAGHPAEIALPQLWTWIQVLRQVGAGQSDRAEVQRQAPGVIDALVPEWRDGQPTLGVPATGFALQEGIVAALHALARDQPWLLILDDMQMADPASIQVLALLADKLARTPLQLIVNWTFYGDERPMNRQHFQQLLKSSGVAAVHLDGLDRSATTQLIGNIVDREPSPALGEELWRRARGNPFFISELARALPPPGTEARLPDAVLGVIGRRLDELDGHCRRLLSAAAVLGAEFDVAELGDVMDLAPGTAQTELAQAYETGLIEEVAGHPGGYRFSHGLLHEAVLKQIAPADRAMLHAAVATTQMMGVATAAYEDAIAAADHAWRAGADLNPESAVEIHEIVIERALARSGYDDVVALVEHALQLCKRLPSKPEHLERQATLWLHLAAAKGILDGQGSAAAADAVARALDIGGEIKGRNFFGAIALRCMMLCAHGRIDEAELIATGLGTQYAESGDPDVGVVSDFACAMVHSLRGNTDELIATGQHMLASFPPPATVTDPLHFLHPRVFCWMAVGEALRGDADAMAENLRISLQLAQSRGDAFNILAARLVWVECQAILGVTEGTAELAAEVERELEAAGGAQYGAAARLVRVWAQTLGTGSGDHDEAFDAFAVLTADGSTVMSTIFLSLLADIEVHHGQIDDARTLLVRAQALADATGEHASDRFISRRLDALSAARRPASPSR